MSNRISPTGHHSDQAWVLAVMHFPADKYLRDSCYAASVANAELKGLGDGDRVELDGSTLQYLIDAPSWNDLQGKMVAAVKGGVIAGDLLASVYLMHKFGMPEPSLRKARSVVRGFAEYERFGDGSPIPRTDETIKKYWRKYHSVSHLWAALRINTAYRYAEPDEIFTTELTTFLAVSAGLLRFGRSFVPHRARPPNPLIGPSGVWEISEDIKPRELVGGDIPDGLAKLLSNYRAGDSL